MGLGSAEELPPPGRWHQGATVELGNLARGVRGGLGSAMPGTSAPGPSRVAGRERGFPGRGIVRECPVPVPV